MLYIKYKLLKNPNIKWYSQTTLNRENPAKCFSLLVVYLSFFGKFQKDCNYVQKRYLHY